MAKTKIILPKVSAYFTDQKAGDRVDNVLTQLAVDLQNLKAADTAAVAGNPAASVGSSGIFFQSFEMPVEPTWTRRTDPTSYVYTANGQAGGKALRATGEIFWEFPENIPFVDDRLYRIRAKFRMTTAPSDSAKDLVAVGIQGFAADGTTLVDRNGTTTATDAHWYAAKDVDMGALSLNTWYTYTGYFSGWGTASATPSTDADAPRLMHSNVRYIRPCFRLNYVGGNGVMEIDYISLEVLTEGAESNQVLKDVVDLGGSRIANGKVDENSINVASLGAITATLGTITAGYIKNAGNTAAIRISGTDTLPSTNFIDFTATGAGTWLKNPFLTLPAASGTATFSGDLSAAGGTFTGTLKAESIEVQNSAGTTRGYISAATSNQLGLKGPSGGSDRVSVGDTTVSMDAGTASVIVDDSTTDGVTVQGDYIYLFADTIVGGTGDNLGFFGQSGSTKSAAYTPTNVTTDRSFNANSTTLDEIADVLGTLIADLQAYKLIG